MTWPTINLLSRLCLCIAQAGAAETADTATVNKNWAERAFADQPAAVAATRLQVLLDDDPGLAKINRSAAGHPLRLADKTYSRGIGVNSNNTLRVTLDRPAARFQADIGIDRNADGQVASVRFRLAAGGRKLFVSDLLRPGNCQSIDVPLEGARVLDLTVDDGGDGRTWDQANWCEPRVVLQDGSTVRLDELATRGGPVASVPFSFVYGGKPSAELLPQWQAAVREEQPDAATRRRTLTFTDPPTALEVQAVATIYLDVPGVDWTLRFTNHGSAETPILEHVRALDAVVALGMNSPCVVHRLRGSTCAAEDWMPLDETLGPGKRIEFGAINGRSSAESPFFHVDWGGGSVVTAVGWSGQWRGAVERDTNDNLRLQAGMQHLRLSLRPGESIRSPRILQLYCPDGDAARVCNLFRRTMLARVVPRVAGQTITPPIAHLSTSFFEMNGSTEANVLAHLNAIRGLGFETFWLDAYWTRDGFPAGMGNYGFPIERAEPRDRFPRGIAAIRDAVDEAGLDYLMWFEPERVHPGTALAKEHPEWVISPGHDGSGLFNLGIPAAREFMTHYLATVIQEYGLDWLRIDFNIDPLPFWEYLNQQEANRVGISEIRYIEGLYRMWDDLRAEYPQLRIDNCASGGRRIDLETCSRAIPLWRSDNTCDMVGANPDTIARAAIKNQLMSLGLNRYVPFSTVGQMGPTPYLFRSGFNGGIAFADDCRPADYPRDLLRQAIAEGKRLRPYWFGNFYPLSEPTLDPAGWCVLQYHRPDEADGVIIGFRRERSPYAAFDCVPREIDATARYAVTRCQGYTPETTVEMTGDRFAGLRLTIDDKPGSQVVEYRKIR